MIDLRLAKRRVAPPLLLLLASSCSGTAEEDADVATQDDGIQTIAAGLATSEELGIMQDALAQSELAGVFDGPASYTILAPTDAAFEALGDPKTTLLENDQRPLLVAILRDHLLPGHITPEAIEAALAEQGAPVTMTTLGQAEVTFAKSGDSLTVTRESGQTAALTGTAVAASNGVVIPIDRILLPPKG